VSDLDEERRRDRVRKEWAAWSAHGYRKLYTPRSVLWVGGIFIALLAVGLLLVFWLAPTAGRP